MKTGFSLCGKTTQGKPCTGPVGDCSVLTIITHDLYMGAFTHDVRCFWVIFDLPTYPDQLSSDMVWPTYSVKRQWCPGQSTPFFGLTETKKGVDRLETSLMVHAVPFPRSDVRFRKIVPIQLMGIISTSFYSLCESQLDAICCNI